MDGRSRQSVLIAGCGYVGTALGEQLARHGHEVFGLRRRPDGLPDAIRPLAADLSRPETLRALPPRIDLVFYTAAASAGDDDAYRAAYVDGVRHLLEALSARPPRRVLFTSSTGVYAQQDGEWVDEDSPTEPDGFSGKRLLEGEALLAGSDIESVVLRLGGIYGPGRTRLIESVRSGRATVRRAPPVFTNRIHRDDCAGALAHLAFLPAPAACYLGVDSEPAEQAEMLAWMAQRLGVAPPREVGPDEAAAPTLPGAGTRRGGSNKRCRNDRLLASGYRFRFPSYREGYDAVLRGMGLVLAALLLLISPAALADEVRPVPAAEAAGTKPPPAWQTKLYADHPLVGVVWDVRAGEPISPAELVGRLSQQRFVLIGERHDQPDHHRLQAWIVGELVRAGRRPSVALEMLDASQDEALGAYLSGPAPQAAGLGPALAWEKSGWPAWSLYQPIAEAALGGGLEIRSANLGRDDTARLSRGGVAALDPERARQLQLGSPLPEAERAAIEREIVEGHCGHAPAEALPRMIAVQRARDAQMALSLRAAAAEADGAVLIAGNGHVRRDHGVPARLREQDPAASATSVAILEVVRGDEDAARYALASGPSDGDESPSARGPALFDYIWFTPRVDDEDACEKFRRQLEGMQAPS
jgi:uncharacterized iron-regulated protein/nucleoside-diphosphate-sugar epimerase